jgi:hypothetical protein
MILTLKLNEKEEMNLIKYLEDNDLNYNVYSSLFEGVIADEFKNASEMIESREGIALTDITKETIYNMAMDSVNTAIKSVNDIKLSSLYADIADDIIDFIKSETKGVYTTSDNIALEFKAMDMNEGKVYITTSNNTNIHVYDLYYEEESGRYFILLNSGNMIYMDEFKK